MKSVTYDPNSVRNCPYCNERATVFYGLLKNKKREYFRIRCANSECPFPCQTDYFFTLEEAIQHWNRGSVLHFNIKTWLQRKFRITLQIPFEMDVRVWAKNGLEAEQIAGEMAKTVDLSQYEPAGSPIITDISLLNPNPYPGLVYLVEDEPTSP